MALLLAVNVVLKRVVVIDPYLRDGEPLNIGGANLLLIAPFVAAIVGSALYWINVRGFVSDYPYKKFHYSKKWTKAYVGGVCAFGAAQLLQVALAAAAVIYFAVRYPEAAQSIRSSAQGGGLALDPAAPVWPIANVMDALLWAALALGAALALASCGLVKYALFKIDLELLRRRQAEEGHSPVRDADERPVHVDLGRQTPPEKGDRDGGAEGGAGAPPIASAGL